MLYEQVSGPFTDLWALGVIIYELVNGSSPWRGNNDMERFENIKECNVPYPRTMDQHAADLIQNLIVMNPLERLGSGVEGTNLDYKSLKKHPFFNGIDWTGIENGTVTSELNEYVIL